MYAAHHSLTKDEWGKSHICICEGYERMASGKRGETHTHSVGGGGGGGGIN